MSWLLSAAEIDRLIAEDIAAGDLTTAALGIGAEPGRIAYTARTAMVLAGSEVAAEMLRRCGANVGYAAPSGMRAEPGTLLLAADGSAAALHGAWKTTQTLLEVLSGIASAARAVVDAAGAVAPGVRVACTRKTFPGARRLSQLAVLAGGATLHRAGLGETVLVFAEHRAFLPEIGLRDLAGRLRLAAPEKKLVIEVADLQEAQAAVLAGFEVIQLEKFTPAATEAAVALARAASPAPLIAAAGGISPANAADYARAGAGLLVTSWPYTARPADVQVRISRT